MAQTARQGDNLRQLPLQQAWTRDSAPRRIARRGSDEPDALVCAWCRAREARYGFRPEDAQGHDDRPSTLCFECFRMEISRRQAVVERMARGWNGEQARLPLEETLRTLDKRRRRAQIAARRAIGA
jgi:hypothetical protein